MSQPADQIRLTDDDVEYLLSVLRAASEPTTTQQLIDALRSRGN